MNTGMKSKAIDRVVIHFSVDFKVAPYSCDKQSVFEYRDRTGKGKTNKKKINLSLSSSSLFNCPYS